MKISTLYLALCLVSLSLFSCKKESHPGIAGQWVTESFYKPDDNQVMNWVRPEGYAEYLTLSKDSRFTYFSDIPLGSGTYLYERNAGEIKLNFETSASGGQSRNELLKVIQITGDRMVVAYSSNPEYKVQFTRVN